MYSATKSDVKKFAQTIETLAKQIQEQIDTNKDFLHTANELVKNNATFVFTLGEVYAVTKLSEKSVTSKAKATTVKSGSYYNVRDANGRFKRA